MARINAVAFLLLAAGACGGGSNSGGPGAGGASGTREAAAAAAVPAVAAALALRAAAAAPARRAAAAASAQPDRRRAARRAAAARPDRRRAARRGRAGRGRSSGVGRRGGRRGGAAVRAAPAGRPAPEARAARQPASGTSSITRRSSGSAPRAQLGAVIVANDGDRIYAVESRRDVEPGPFGLPWRSRFRLAAYDNDAAPAWTFDAAPDDVVSDVAVHASGDVTVAVLHFLPERLAYDLVRLDRNGVVRANPHDVRTADAARERFWSLGSTPAVSHEVRFRRRHGRRLGATAAGRRRYRSHLPVVPGRPRRRTRAATDGRSAWRRSTGKRAATSSAGRAWSRACTPPSPSPGRTTSSARTSRRFARSWHATR